MASQTVNRVIRCLPVGAAVPAELSFVCSTEPPVWSAPVASLPPWLLAKPLDPPLAMLNSVEPRFDVPVVSKSVLKT